MSNDFGRGGRRMKQEYLFDMEPEGNKKIEGKYTTKIKSPFYTPKGGKIFPQELVDVRKSNMLIAKIQKSNLSKEEKDFLIIAAYRHIVFDFGKIADYYSTAAIDIQELMEESALVIIDFNAAIENGYVKLSDDIADQYLEEYENDIG